MSMHWFGGARLMLALGVLEAVFGCSLDFPVGPMVQGDGGGPGGGNPSRGGPFASCATPKDCKGVNCCASEVVTGGTFNRKDNDPQSPATLSDFRLDVYEVTVGRFRAFVEAGNGTSARPPAPGDGARPNLPGSGWLKDFDGKLLADTAALQAALHCNGGGSGSIEAWTESPGAQENLPINCITWYEAFAFCAWDGGWLPTAAEWNYAAVGGNEQRPYPWGSEAIDPSRVTYCGNHCRLVDLNAVGSKSPKGDGKWKQADLLGNLWEWVLDTAAGLPKPCNDCASLAAPKERVRFGGNLSSEDTTELSPWKGSTLEPEVRDFSNGVRCARPK